jgi:outer membrane receptor protein involved in Fe transport
MSSPKNLVRAALTALVACCWPSAVRAEAKPPATLQPLTIEELVAIEITTASRRAEPLSQAPATVYVINEDDIRWYGLRNLRDLLRIVPGVDWSFDQMALQGGLRGFATNFANTLLMVNGREVENLLAGEPFISFQFQMHNVQRVEVLMGPSSALYGANAFAGIINIVTKLQDQTPGSSGYVEQTVGSWSTSSTGVVLQRREPDVSVYGALNYHVTDNEDLTDWLTRNADVYRSRQQPWTPPGANEKFVYRNDARSVMAEAEAEWKGLYAGVLLIHNYAEGGIEELRPAFGERTLRREQFLWYAGYRRALTEAVDVRLEYINFTENDLDVWTFARPAMSHPSPPGVVADPNGVGGQHGFFGLEGATKRRGEGQVDAQIFSGNVLTLGGSVELWDLGLGPLCCTAVNLLPSNNRDLTLITNPDLLNFWKAGAFVQDRQSFFGRVHLTLGVRIDGQAAVGSPLRGRIINPRVGLVAEPWTGASLRVLFGRAYREPNVFELQSTPELEPATMNAYEVGYTQTIGPFLLQSSAYLDRVDNAILANPFASSDRNQPGYISGQAESRGIEEWFQLRLPRFRAFGFYSYVQREPFRDPVSGLQSASVGVSPHKFALGASVDLYNTLYLSLYDVWNSAVDDVATSVTGTGVEIQRVPYFNSLSLTVGARDLDIGGIRLDASVNVDNLLDRDNLRPNIRGSDPRVYVQNHFSAMMTVRLRL